MKWKLFSMMLAATLALAACGMDNGGNNGTDEGQNNNDNVEQTRFGDDDQGTDNMNNRNNNNEFNNGNRTRNTDEQGNNQNNNNNENQYELADEAADRISDQVDSIDNAYVVKTDNNAYVAAELDQDNNNANNNNTNNNNTNINGTTNNNDNNNEGGELTDAVKEEISGIVRTVDPDVDNVYVSTNPDFFDLTNNYADDVDSGEPVEGLFDQMGNMIERVFPQQGNN